MPLQFDLVLDDPELLDMLVTDAERSDDLWTATAYWRTYCRRMQRELARHGLSGFRANQRILKGFALGGPTVPTLPDSAWKRGLWHVIEALPGVSKIVSEYRRAITAEHTARAASDKQWSIYALNEIERRVGEIVPPEGVCNGGATDGIVWRDKWVTPAWVMYLARLVDFYDQVPPKSVTTILEIGPGLGLSTLAHCALNPHLRAIINVDIVPILYVSTQFLKSIPELKVNDCRETRNAAFIEADGDHLTIQQLAPWQLERLEGEVDFSFNAYSIQEMEIEVCRNYATHILDHTRGGVCLHSRVSGHQQGAGGQREPITLDYLESLFVERFPNRARLDGVWPRLFNGDPAQTVLMTPIKPAKRRRAAPGDTNAAMS